MKTGVEVMERLEIAINNFYVLFSKQFEALQNMATGLKSCSRTTAQGYVNYGAGAHSLTS